ncbi:hypothetical protein DMENIID0001_171560 [Sergentomyia squamirostris]
MIDLCSSPGQKKIDAVSQRAWRTGLTPSSYVVIIAERNIEIPATFILFLCAFAYSTCRELFDRSFTPSTLNPSTAPSEKSPITGAAVTVVGEGTKTRDV